MAEVPLEHGLLLAIALFALGLLTVLVRRNIVFILLGIEIMLNAAGVAFVLGGARWGQPDGQVMFIFILTVAAAEVAVGLGLVLQLYRRHETVDADAPRRLRG
jgi:NADH-quinone oxidoreductase subunit K